MTETKWKDQAAAPQAVVDAKDNLVEIVARAIHAASITALGGIKPYEAHHLARAALAAIESSGTHVVVPKEPTSQMLANADKFEDMGFGLRTTYSAFIDARPRSDGETP